MGCWKRKNIVPIKGGNQSKACHPFFYLIGKVFQVCHFRLFARMGFANISLSFSRFYLLSQQFFLHMPIKEASPLSSGGGWMEPFGLPTTRAQGAESAPLNPVRVQVAAVAAQQSALIEEEEKLARRRVGLEKQEEQLVAHLEEKRSNIIHLSQRTQAERAALEEERKQFEIRCEALAVAAQELEEKTGLLQGSERELTDKRLRFNSQYELGRAQLREAWQRLRQDQYRWKHRRGKERAALKVREGSVASAENRLLEVQRQIINEKRTWENSRAVVQAEVEGLDARALNQRQKIIEQLKKIARLDAEILDREHRRAQLAEVPQQPAPPETSGYRTVQLAAGNPLPAKQEGHADFSTQEAWQKRFQYLERFAGALADQRAQLIEQWHRLGHLQDAWGKEKGQALQELEVLARRIVDRERLINQREQTHLNADAILRRRHDEYIAARRQMIAWRARLRVREKAWEGERDHLLVEFQAGQNMVDRHLGTLVDLRQSWARRRGQELEGLSAENRDLETIRQEQARRHLYLVEQAEILEKERRIIVEKSLSLELYRKEFLAKGDNPTIERRLERLRRRWITLNATAMRRVAQERQVLKDTLFHLEKRFADLKKRLEYVGRKEVEIGEKQSILDLTQVQEATRWDRMQHALQFAEAQRQTAEQQVIQMKEEIERIAGALIDEPDPPTSEALKAA